MSAVFHVSCKPAYFTPEKLADTSVVKSKVACTLCQTEFKITKAQQIWVPSFVLSIQMQLISPMSAGNCIIKAGRALFLGVWITSGATPSLQIWRIWGSAKNCSSSRAEAETWCRNTRKHKHQFNKANLTCQNMLTSWVWIAHSSIYTHCRGVDFSIFIVKSYLS